MRAARRKGGSVKATFAARPGSRIGARFSCTASLQTFDSVRLPVCGR